MFTIDIENKEGAAIAAALFAKGIKPHAVERFVIDGTTRTELAYNDDARNDANEARNSDVYAGAILVLTMKEKAEQMPPLIYTRLPNGKTLVVSADVPTEQLEPIFNRAMSV